MSFQTVSRPRRCLLLVSIVVARFGMLAGAEGKITIAIRHKGTTDFVGATRWFSVTDEVWPARPCCRRSASNMPPQIMTNGRRCTGRSGGGCPWCVSPSAYSLTAWSSRGVRRSGGVASRRLSDESQQRRRRAAHCQSARRHICWRGARPSIASRRTSGKGGHPP